MTDDNRYESENAYPMLFPHLITPQEGMDRDRKPTGKRAFSADFLMSPDSKDFIALRKMVVEMIKDKFPNKYQLAVDAATVRNPDGTVKEKPTFGSVLDAMIDRSIVNTPFKSGTAAADNRIAKGKTDSEYTRGQYIFKARKSELKRDGSPLSPPAIGGMEGSRAVDYDTDEKRGKAASKFFTGAEAFFEVTVAAYTAGDGGITAYLNQVFLNGRGTRREQGGSVAERFGKHVGHLSSVNPLAVAELS